LEGLSQGLCVVAGIDEWCRMHIHKFTQSDYLPWYVPSKDKLMEDILLLVNDRDLREEYGKRARSFMKKFWNEQKVIENLIAFYENEKQINKKNKKGYDMPVSVAFIRELEEVDPKLRRVLLSLLEELERQREESVTKKEFNELKEIVRDIGKTVKELAEAQKRTEEEIAKLSRGLQITREQLGGLSRSVGYALENEAYRHLPSILKKYYNIETIERLIRTYINNSYSNIYK